MQILGLLGMYFDAVAAEVQNNLLLFRLARPNCASKSYFQYKIFQGLLPISDGLSMLCVYVFTSLIFIYVALLEYSLILIVIRLEKEKLSGITKEQIDFGSMLVYYAGFGTFNLIYVFHVVYKQQINVQTPSIKSIKRKISKSLALSLKFKLPICAANLPFHYSDFVNVQA